MICLDTSKSMDEDSSFYSTILSHEDVSSEDEIAAEDRPINLDLTEVALWSSGETIGLQPFISPIIKVQFVD